MLMAVFRTHQPSICISKLNPQITVLQMSTTNNISSLWDEMPLIDSEEKEESD